MPTDVRTHPDAPDFERLQNVVIEPIPAEEIRRRRSEGEVLVEDMVNEREDLDVRAPLSTRPGEPVEGDVGTALYRLVQLFGTPQFPEYAAGEDISDRGETTYKYLFRATVDDSENLPDEWLMTIRDWRVELGVGVAEWRDRAEGGESEDEPFRADARVALTSLALAQQLTASAVECDYENILY